MRDLFSQGTCVRAYMRTYVSVTLRSICAHARARYRIRALHDDVRMTFLGDGGRTELALRNARVLRSQMHKRRMNAADGWQL